MPTIKKLISEPRKMSNEELLVGLQRGSSKVIKEIYRLSFPVCRKYGQARGGKMNQIKEIFEECLGILYEKAIQAEFKLSKPLENYLFGIFRNRWLKVNQNGNGKNTRLELPTHLADAQPEPVFDERNGQEVLLEKLEVALSKLDAKCRDLILDHYGAGIKLTELARDLETTPEVLRVTKFRCLKKLKTLM